MPWEGVLTTGVVHVVAAVLVGRDGRVLINQRLPGTHMAGRWEFPGGKVEPRESVEDALARELLEELGVVPLCSRPLIRVRHDYPDKSVLLDAWRVDAWQGTIRPQEGHPLEWVGVDELPSWDLLAADLPILKALALPPRYAITPNLGSDALLATVGRLLDSGHSLIQLRGRAVLEVAATAALLCRERGASLLVNADAKAVVALDGVGVHLSAARLLAADHRPLPEGRMVAASCHDTRELAHAAGIGCDFAVLGPVLETVSHPGDIGMGWERFAALVDGAGLPVFALGGLTEDDTATAWRHHGQGIAGISAWSP